MGQSDQGSQHWFHANLVALLTKTEPVQWVRSASHAFDEDDFGPRFDRRHGVDVFAAYQMTHTVDGRVAQIEYDQEDCIFVNCDALAWSAPLEDDVVCQAEHQSQSQGRYEKCPVNITNSSMELPRG